MLLKLSIQHSPIYKTSASYYYYYYYYYYYTATADIMGMHILTYVFEWL
jgi:hypothetical protein